MLVSSKRMANHWHFQAGFWSIPTFQETTNHLTIHLSLNINMQNQKGAESLIWQWDDFRIAVGSQGGCFPFFCWKRVSTAYCWRWWKLMEPCTLHNCDKPMGYFLAKLNAARCSHHYYFGSILCSPKKWRKNTWWAVSWDVSFVLHPLSSEFFDSGLKWDFYRFLLWMFLFSCSFSDKPENRKDMWMEIQMCWKSTVSLVLAPVKCIYSAFTVLRNPHAM